MVILRRYGTKELIYEHGTRRDGELGFAMMFRLIRKGVRLTAIVLSSGLGFVLASEKVITCEAFDIRTDVHLRRQQRETERFVEKMRYGCSLVSVMVTWAILEAWMQRISRNRLTKFGA